jgi:hypothetical protein
MASVMTATNGIGITAIVRDMLVLHGLPFKEANDLATILDENITRQDFLFTYNGTTFTKTYDPATNLRLMAVPVTYA